MNRQQRRRGTAHGAPGIDRTEAERWALASCSLRGCTCRPELTLRHAGGATHVGIAHDSWCPVLAAQEATQ